MIQRLEVGKRFSEVAIHNGIVYLAGQVPLDETLGTYAQTQQVLSEIDKWLAKANSNKSRILMAQIYLADMADYAELNRAWDEWVAEDAAPPRACVEAKLANPNWKVEIVVTAAVISL